MTDLAMEREFENINRRLTSIEQILPTLATKQDLERFATKQDLEGYATKQDLERFATKQDLEERFATKEDLREGLADARRYALVLNEEVRADIRLVAEHLAHLILRLERKGVI